MVRTDRDQSNGLGVQEVDFGFEFLSRIPIDVMQGVRHKAEPN
jgi:hypothetical protein